MKRMMRRLRQRASGEDGYAGTPILLAGSIILFLIIVQAAFWFIGRNTGNIAAQEAYSAARAYESTIEAGEEAADVILDRFPGHLSNANVTITRSETTVTVTVTGDGVSLIPGLQLAPVVVTVTGPVERWVPAG